MKFVKLSHDAIKPKRATAGSAGYDLYAPKATSLAPGEQKTIMTDIGWSNIPKHIGGFLQPRSGKAHKMGIMLLGGTIDSDYVEGQNIGAILYNSGSETWNIKKGEAIAQMVVQPVVFMDDDEVVDEDRTGGFGSTDK